MSLVSPMSYQINRWKKIKAFHQGTDLLNTKKVEIVNLSTYEIIATVLCIERWNKKILMECHTSLPFFLKKDFLHFTYETWCHNWDCRACGVHINSGL